MEKKILINFLIIFCCSNVLLLSLQTKFDKNDDDDNNINYNSKEHPINEKDINTSLNKDFWDHIYQNSILHSKTKYNALSGDKVCFTCPIDRNIFSSLYHEAIDAMSSATSGRNEIPPRVTISWATQLNENRIIFFCRNNTRLASNSAYFSSFKSNNNKKLLQQQQQNEEQIKDINDLEYSCEQNKLCLLNVKKAYPNSFQCFVKSYILSVKLNVIDSVKFDYQKEVQIHENQMFTVKCEVPETNPISSVRAFIDRLELQLTALDKKLIDNRMTINTYSYEVMATKEMNGKKVKCEAQMKDIPIELSNQIDFRSHLTKEYSLNIFYFPTCLHKERIYRTGINRSIIIECPINGSNPDVTYYKLIAPTTRTKFDLMPDQTLDQLKRMARFYVLPQSQADFGLYECIPRSLAGTAKCDINIELGATPNPPEQCSVQESIVNNKTFAQFSCRAGFNQGGTSAFLSIYEIVDEQLKLSGRVNIDENKYDKEIPYITPIEENKYYMYAIMQENNYGNSTIVYLSLGKPNDPNTVRTMLFSFSSIGKKLHLVGGIFLSILAFVFICSCCCCYSNDLTSLSTQSSSDRRLLKSCLSFFCCCTDCDSNDLNKKEKSGLKDDNIFLTSSLSSSYKKASFESDPHSNAIIYNKNQYYASSNRKYSNTYRLNYMNYKSNPNNEDLNDGKKLIYGDSIKLSDLKTCKNEQHNQNENSEYEEDSEYYENNNNNNNSRILFDLNNRNNKANSSKSKIYESTTQNSIEYSDLHHNNIKTKTKNLYSNEDGDDDEEKEFRLNGDQKRRHKVPKNINYYKYQFNNMYNQEVEEEYYEDSNDFDENHYSRKKPYNFIKYNDTSNTKIQNKEDHVIINHNNNNNENHENGFITSKFKDTKLNTLTGSGLESIKLNKTETNNNNNSNNNNNNNHKLNSIYSTVNKQRNNFQDELNSKLKYLNEKSENLVEPTTTTNNQTNQTNQNKNLHSIESKALKTGTTENPNLDLNSTSSSFSSASHNDLTVHKQQQQLSKTKLNYETNSNNSDQSNYSLIKTTLNNSQQPNNAASTATSTKPLIVKPKPKNTSTTTTTTTAACNSFNTKNLKDLTNTSTIITKLNTNNYHNNCSPSTSVTDLSSSNGCTPQHKYNHDIGSSSLLLLINNTTHSNSPTIINNITTPAKTNKQQQQSASNVYTTLNRRNQHVKNSEC